MSPVTDKDIIASLKNRLHAELYWEGVYREALRRIARGEGDPLEIAWEALGDDDNDE